MSCRAMTCLCTGLVGVGHRGNGNGACPAPNLDLSLFSLSLSLYLYLTQLIIGRYPPVLYHLRYNPAIEEEKKPKRDHRADRLERHLAYCTFFSSLTRAGVGTGGIHFSFFLFWEEGQKKRGNGGIWLTFSTTGCHESKVKKRGMLLGQDNIEGRPREEG